MSKRSKKKRRKTKRQRPPRRPPVDIDQVLDRGEQLINDQRFEDTIELLAPLVDAYPREPALRYMLGHARFMVGEVWDGLDECERAQRQARDPAYWWLLGLFYIQLELNAHTLAAFREALKWPELSPSEVHGRMQQTIAELEDRVAGLSAQLGVPARQVERGMHAMEEGIRAMNQERYGASASTARRAIRDLGDWPPPHNNLSLALFYDGRPQAAIAASQRVLDGDPNNLQALSNSIRFLALCDREDEARRLWARLVHLKPDGVTEQIKAAEAAAFVEQDESVYRLLSPLDDEQVLQELSDASAAQIQHYLAVAEANTGRKGAQRRLRATRDFYPLDDLLLDALEQGQPGPGHSARYPYHSSGELLPRPAMEEWIELASREEHMPEQRFRAQVARFVERYPQLVRLGEKWIWEEELVEPGISLLSLLDTPAARAVLRRFGLSQAGDDEARMSALFHLLEVGEIEQGTQLRVWREGEWTELVLQRYDISDEYVSVYTPQVAALLEAGLEAFQEQDFDRAEPLFRQAIELEPRAKQAYNNLSAIYSRQNKPQQAREMLLAVLEIEPLYVMARCNLALYMLAEDDVDGAEEMIAPLMDVTQFNPPELAHYAYTRARILVVQDDLEAARNALEMALDLAPDYEPAQDLLERLDTLEPFRALKDTFGDWIKEYKERDRKKRMRHQTKLATLDPSLSEALAIYTKDALTGMGHLVIPWGGWSALRKAELIAEIAGVLGGAEWLPRVLEGLEQEDRAALDEVMDQGGKMPWQAFDVRYGNDLDESFHWNYHEPESVMGRLRSRGLLAEATVGEDLWVVVPVEVREAWDEMRRMAERG